MQAQSIKNDEKLINNIMFLYILGVAISGWVLLCFYSTAESGNVSFCYPAYARF